MAVFNKSLIMTYHNTVAVRAVSGKFSSAIYFILVGHTKHTWSAVF